MNQENPPYIRLSKHGSFSSRLAVYYTEQERKFALYALLPELRVGYDISIESNDIQRPLSRLFIGPLLLGIFTSESNVGNEKVDALEVSDIAQTKEALNVHITNYGAQFSPLRNELCAMWESEQEMRPGKRIVYELIGSRIVGESRGRKHVEFKGVVLYPHISIGYLFQNVKKVFEGVHERVNKKVTPASSVCLFSRRPDSYNLQRALTPSQERGLIERMRQRGTQRISFASDVEFALEEQKRAVEFAESLNGMRREMVSSFERFLHENTHLDLDKRTVPGNQANH
ncbi:hypothetical protein HYZ97_00500 [Candidatus Pacearchaeota archaeon]|nr:hypothetical protein [Candidatus Pacearchaeota archaeon]